MRVKAVKMGEGEGVVLGKSERRLLTAAEFQGLADVPPEAEWFANISNPRTRRAYQGDIREFMAFVGIMGAGEFQRVTRAHALAWRKELERRGHAAATVRRKLSALASLFDHLCERNAVPFNPMRRVKRPSSDTNEGKPPAIGDGQARALLNAPSADTLKGVRLRRTGDRGGADVPENADRSRGGLWADREGPGVQLPGRGRGATQLCAAQPRQHSRGRSVLGRRNHRGTAASPYLRVPAERNPRDHRGNDWPRYHPPGRDQRLPLRFRSHRGPDHPGRPRAAPVHTWHAAGLADACLKNNSPGRAVCGWF